MSITVKLLDGKEYAISRESSLADGDEEMRTKMLLVEDLLSGTQFKNLMDNINNRERIISRNERLAALCESNLFKESTSSEETIKWFDKLQEANNLVTIAEDELMKFHSKASTLANALRTEPVKVARWVINKQHGKPLAEADCLMNYDLACTVCAAILGIDLGKQEDKKAEGGEKEENSPLSVAPKANESG